MATGLPHLKESSLRLGGIHPQPAPPVHGLRTSSVSQEPDGGLAVVTGDGDEFGENRGFLLLACPQIPGLPGLYQLPCTCSGHRFLLHLWVTPIMRNQCSLQ